MVYRYICYHILLLINRIAKKKNGCCPKIGCSCPNFIAEICPNIGIWKNLAPTPAWYIYAHAMWQLPPPPHASYTLVSFSKIEKGNYLTFLRVTSILPYVNIYLHLIELNKKKKCDETDNWWMSSGTIFMSHTHTGSNVEKDSIRERRLAMCWRRP